MTSNLGALVVIATVPDDNLAVKIAESLLESRLAACVHVQAPGHSLYRWQGKIERASECVLIIKTQAARYAELESEIRRLHTYDLPEIIAFPVTHGLPAYLDWIADETRPSV